MVHGHVVHHTIDYRTAQGARPAYGTIINATIARLADKQMLARRYPKCYSSRAQEYRARVSEQEFVEIQVAASHAQHGRACANATGIYIDRARCALTIAQQYTQLRGRAHQSTPKTDYAARVSSPRAAPGD